MHTLKNRSFLLTNIHTKIWESEFSFMESEFVVATFPWKVENEKNPRTLYSPSHIVQKRDFLEFHHGNREEKYETFTTF